MALRDLGIKVRYKIDLPGGQARLREAILFVTEQAAGHDYFGKIKLNKILWRADFRAYHERLRPVTGRQYQVLEMGPAPYEMVPVLNDLVVGGLIVFQESGVPLEQRPALVQSVTLRHLKNDDLKFLTEALDYYRLMTAAEASHESHGLAWRTRAPGEPIPYDASIFNDEITPDHLPLKLENRFHEIARAKNLRSA